MDPLDPEMTLQREIDEIYSLLTYAIVRKYWEDDDRNGRGYNVGCVLVSPDNEVLDWGINSVHKSGNCTQHGEVRLLTGYLDRSGIYSLSGHSMYTSLEPCAMCAGMMIMSSIKRTVNGQRDYYFAGALERFALDSNAHGGFSPYPRAVLSEETPSAYGRLLDAAYHDYIGKGAEPVITRFLASPAAKRIFDSALQSFLDYEVSAPSAGPVLSMARVFFQKLPSIPK